MEQRLEVARPSARPDLELTGLRRREAAGVSSPPARSASRVVRAKVAGPAALLVAKVFKIHERRGSARANDKDALDVLRILRDLLEMLEP